jgi:hypothetical protein
MPRVSSPCEIDAILSRKLHERLRTTSTSDKDRSSTNTEHVPVAHRIDPELLVLIDRFFHLTYVNTIPMVNLLATAVGITCTAY